jgi:hypothetical protein
MKTDITFENGQAAAGIRDPLIYQKISIILDKLLGRPAA